ncbi:MAG: hypothetical protein HND39_00855 [Ignavibacteriota bacterium]|nr:MAG: hypothetical protein HND39_00855 [Ignavibacteriota bacterium]
METLKVSYRIIWIGENNFTIFLAPERERELNIVPPLKNLFLKKSSSVFYPELISTET